MGSRIPSSVFVYCKVIAEKVAKGDDWERSWTRLIKAMYSKDGDSSLQAQLGLPSSVPPVDYNPDDIDAMISKFEEKLTQLGEDGRIAQIDLSKQLQRQQQTLQLITKVSKKMHDTALAVIRTIG